MAFINLSLICNIIALRRIIQILYFFEIMTVPSTCPFHWYIDLDGCMCIWYIVFGNCSYWRKFCSFPLISLFMFSISWYFVSKRNSLVFLCDFLVSFTFWRGIAGIVANIVFILLFFTNFVEKVAKWLFNWQLIPHNYMLSASLLGN